MRIKASRAFTLAELLVCMFIMGIISTVLIALATQSSALVSQGASVMELNQKARNGISRMAPYLASAVPSKTDFRDSALISPNLKVDAPTAADLISYKTLQFTTTEDYLAEGYNPTVYWTPSNDTFVYEFFFDDSDGDVFKKEDGTTLPLGRVVLRKIVDGTPVTTPAPRVIAHRVQLFRCYAISSYAVEVVMNTVGKRKGPQGNMIDVFEEQNAVLSIPSGSY